MLKAKIIFDNGAVADLSNVSEILLKHVGTGKKETFDFDIGKIGSDKNDSIFIRNVVGRSDEVN